LSLCEIMSRAFEEGEGSQYQEDCGAIVERFMGIDLQSRRRLFREYVYYAFPQRSFVHDGASEVFTWLKDLGIKFS
jgi:hypothetical protein